VKKLSYNFRGRADGASLILGPVRDFGDAIYVSTRFCGEFMWVACQWYRDAPER
jgi:hypothetical protein